MIILHCFLFSSRWFQKISLFFSTVSYTHAIQVNFMIRCFFILLPFHFFLQQNGKECAQEVKKKERKKKTLILSSDNFLWRRIKNRFCVIVITAHLHCIHYFFSFCFSWLNLCKHAFVSLMLYTRALCTLEFF